MAHPDVSAARTTQEDIQLVVERLSNDHLFHSILLHEAGHAVAAIAMGFVIDYAIVTLHVDRSAEPVRSTLEGHVHTYNPRVPRGAETMSRLEGHRGMVQAVAGITATTLRFPQLSGSPEPWNGYEETTDVQQAFRELEIMVPAYEPGQRLVAMRRSFAEAGKILNDRWPAVLSVASALGQALKAGTRVEGAVLREIVKPSTATR